jgi:sugar phosphate isomerase/epimerase
MSDKSRRNFLRSTGFIAGASLLGDIWPQTLFAAENKKKVILSGHLWVYASRFTPPDWDCTPILDEVFGDFKYAGLEGVEMMEGQLRHSDSVLRIGELSRKYAIPVTGISYYGDMWDKNKHNYLVEDIEMVVERLHQLGGTTFGITVGDRGRKKTEEELDAQGDLLKKVLKICKKNKVEPNLHNHDFEVIYEMHDFKGTIARVPELKLGPDVSWLVRAGIDPVWFIKTYGKQMVYLHLRDQRADKKWTEVLGEGITNFSAIAKALQEINYKGRAAVELAFDELPVKPVRESWKLSTDYVRKVFEW